MLYSFIARLTNIAIKDPLCGFRIVVLHKIRTSASSFAAIEGWGWRRDAELFPGK